MKGSPLLHISSRVRQGDKGGCWSNTQTNRQWQKHTFVARRLALISDSAKSRRERQVSAFELGLFRGGRSLSRSLLWRICACALHSYHSQSCSTTDSAYIFSRTAKGMVAARGGAEHPHHWQRTWHRWCWCWLFEMPGLWWADRGLLRWKDCSRFNSSVLAEPAHTHKSQSTQQWHQQVVIGRLSCDYASIWCMQAACRRTHKVLISYSATF